MSARVEAERLLDALIARGDWREGLAGHYNIVAFDGGDITGVAQAFGKAQRAFIAAAPRLVRGLLDQLAAMEAEQSALRSSLGQLSKEMKFLQTDPSLHGSPVNIVLHQWTEQIDALLRGEK